MPKLPITIATWDYDRVRALIDGRVPVAGCDVNYLPMQVEEIFHRAHLSAEFEVAEIAMGVQIVRLGGSAGADYVALPIFLSRMFRHSAIYIRTDRGIAKPQDLKGKRVGVPSYQMAAALWARGFLKYVYGVDYADMSWRQGGLEIPGRREMTPLKLPPGFPLEVIAPGKTLSAMLAAGELDALISARTPSCYDAKHPQVRRLFEDYATAERDYYRQTGVFPIMHALGIRKDVHARHPWLGMELLKAFTAAKTIATAEFEQLAALKLTLPWIGPESASTRALMGDDFWPYGVGANRKTLDLMCRYVHEQGLAPHRVTVEELFPRSTTDLPKV